MSQAASRVIIAAQSILILLLASWLYLEYLNNPNMQAYLAQSLQANLTLLLLGIGILTGTVTGVTIAVVRKRGKMNIPTTETSPARGPRDELEDTNIAAQSSVIESCPYCQGTLRTLSPGRYQCRDCRRYFKD